MQPSKVSSTVRIIRLSIAIFTALLIPTAFAGCNTTKGAKQDIEELGDAIEDAADEAADG